MDPSSASDSPEPPPPELAQVRNLILTATGKGPSGEWPAVEEAPDDLDLRASGMIDSLGFLELVAAIEEEYGIELDFEGIDPRQITILGPLARHVQAQVLAARGGSLEE